MHLCRTLAFAASLLLSLAPALIAEEKQATPEDKEFEQAFDRWKTMLAEVAEAQVKWASAAPADRQNLTPAVDKFVKQADAMLPKLQAAAEKAYLADDQNTKLADLLFYMALAHLRNDNHEAALRLATLLIEHKLAPPLILDAHRIAASASFATMKLDDAKKHIAAAADGKAVTDESLLHLLAVSEACRPWLEREEKLRAAEEKANDLPRVKLHTSQGDIVLELFENEAPNTVANFISLVSKGFYDGTQFHRVLPGFMAQGGDPLSKDPAANFGKIGTGGPSYMIEDECGKPERRSHFRGSLSMAHPDSPNSNGSQFFLTFVPTPQLDGRHTVFGRVIEGIDVLAKIQRVDPEKPNNETLDTIIKAEVVRKRDHAYEPKKVGES